MGDSQTLASKLKRDNEQMLEALHKEQDKSYKLLRDLHQNMQENKAMKSAYDEQRAELEKLKIEKHKMIEVSEDNQRLHIEVQRMQ